ncbi:MAG: hypothetical protein BWY82_00844 [Verrucomicrobia bacterium ADurb.Bin474]|nr:MAG: hypothetical protein BWY82_00844 [Verrucomicrobia bacterium ADurb.Bin474]
MLTILSLQLENIGKVDQRQQRIPQTQHPATADDLGFVLASETDNLLQIHLRHCKPAST